MSRVLFVSDQLPGRQIGLSHAGNAQYVSSFLKFFQERGDPIVFLLFDPKVDFLSANADEFPFRLVGPAFDPRNNKLTIRSKSALLSSLAWICFSWLPVNLRRPLAVLRRGMRRLRGFSHRMGRFRSDEEKLFFREVVAELKPEIIIFDGIFNFCESPTEGQVWMVTHEVKHLRAESFQQQGFKVAPTGINYSLEAEILKQCANLVAIQWDDARVLQEMSPASRVIVVPASFNLPPSSSTDSTQGRCAFVASASFHNVQGLRWFLETCWVKISRRHPYATLGLYGSVGAQVGRLPAGVIDFGVVDDLEFAYASAEVVIVPLKVGSGLKVKLVEAITHHVPTVSTSVGAQGLTGLEPQPFIVADTADDFVDAVCRLLSDSGLRAEMSARCRTAAKRFSPQVAFSDLAEALSS